MISRVALALALIAAVAGAVSGLGCRWEWWTFRQGFSILRFAAWSGLAGAALALVGGVLAGFRADRQDLVLALAGVVLGLAVFGWPWHLARTARSVPAIHDITTDTERPPLFSAIIPLRGNAANPSEYGGEEVARQQRQAYPDIKSLPVSVAPDQAFQRALDAVRRLRWSLVSEDRQVGRIEAYDRTFWYGFVDDVVIRITPRGSGSLIDVRSVSRVGRSDVGTNARRIRRFFAELRKGERQQS
jgi:uncharacterized protein (DUF1499 family)